MMQGEPGMTATSPRSTPPAWAPNRPAIVTPAPRQVPPGLPAETFALAPLVGLSVVEFVDAMRSDPAAMRERLRAALAPLTDAAMDRLRAAARSR